MRYALLLVTLFASLSTQAAIEAYRFQNQDQEAIYNKLIAELRCLVCQNQNLADSNAELAQDLRREVYKMVSTGESEQGIVDFMVARYGDFVLYRPPLNASTMLLWVGPFVLLACAVLMLVIYLRHRAVQKKPELADTERQQVRQLLDDDD